MTQQYQNIVTFIRNLYNEPSSFIPLHTPVFNGNEKKYLNECIDTTFVSSVGKFVDKFEEETAKYTGASKAVACVNGTNALHLALKLVGVEAGTEVITQPLTFIATANAIKYCNADPVFIDVDKDTLGLSPEKLENWLKNSTTYNKSTNQQINKSTNKPITACVPMHTFGHPCKIDEIIDICNKYNIPVVEDAAESLGSFYKNQHTGTFGEIGVLSFNGNKILTTGGGGMLLFQDEKLAKKAKHLTTQAKVSHPWEFVHDKVGYNYRMPNINAALGVAQLEQLPKFLESKRKIAAAYKNFLLKNDLFESIGKKKKNLSPFVEKEITFFSEPTNATSNYWLNTLILENREQRDQFLKYTNEKGIMTRPAWTLMNKLEMFKNCQCGDLSNSEWLEDRVVNIPSSYVQI
jgi:aminotransferase in exopolysaccharide biosynthesis